MKDFQIKHLLRLIKPYKTIISVSNVKNMQQCLYILSVCLSVSGIDEIDEIKTDIEMTVDFSLDSVVLMLQCT